MCVASPTKFWGSVVCFPQNTIQWTGTTMSRPRLFEHDPDEFVSTTPHCCAAVPQQALHKPACHQPVWRQALTPPFRGLKMRWRHSPALRYVFQGYMNQELCAEALLRDCSDDSAGDEVLLSRLATFQQWASDSRVCSAAHMLHFSSASRCACACLVADDAAEVEGGAGQGGGVLVTLFGRLPQPDRCAGRVPHPT